MVDLNRQGWTQLFLPDTSLAESLFKMEEDHRRFKKLQLLFVITPTHYSLYGNMRVHTNKLKIHPFGMATLKNNNLQWCALHANVLIYCYCLKPEIDSLLLT